MEGVTLTAAGCSAFDLLPSPVWVFDPGSLSIRWANAAAGRLLGYAANDLLALAVSDIHVEEQRADLAEAARQVLPIGEEAGYWTLVTRDGARVDARSTWRLVDFDGGVAILSAVCEMRPLSEEERYSGAMTRTAARLLGLGRWAYDMEAKALHWSKRTYDLFGMDPSLPPPGYSGYVELIDPDERDAMVSEFRRIAASNPSCIEFQHKVARGDGSVIYIKCVGERQSWPGRDIVIGTAQDVTQMVLSSQRLTEAESLLRLAGDHARFGAWQADLDTRRINWTDQVARIHGMVPGYSPSIEEGIGFYAPEYREEINAAFETCARSGKDFELVCQVITAQGERVWVRSMGSAVRSADGRIVSVQGAFQDISALVEAENRAVRADAERSLVLESISDAFFALDRDWKFTYLNKRAEELLRQGKAELLSRSIWEAFPEALGTAFQHEYEAVVATGLPTRFDAYFAPLHRWFEVSAYPMVQGLSVYFRDVSADRARSEHLRLVDAAVSRQNDILLITSAEPIDAGSGGPRIVYVNEAFTRRTGYTRSEVIGLTPRILQGPRTDRAELARIRAALENWEPVRAELINYTKDGEPFNLELDIVPLADERGWYTHWVAVERDITDRKRAEAALQASEARFQLVSRATNDVIWDWDFRTRKLWWSESVTEVLGYTAEDAELAPSAWTNRIHPEDRDATLAKVRGAIAGDGDRWSYEYRFLRKDGSTAIVHNRAFIIRDTEGAAVRILGSLADLTEQRELEQRLRESQKLEAVGQLTGGVAHDFNNLLTVILGNAEELSQGLADNEQLRLIADMTAMAAERGAELTSRLLSFARRQPLQPKISDISALVAGMEGLFRRTLSESIEIGFDRCPVPWMTEVDPGQLEVALLNLVVNARDAMPSGGRLLIETANTCLDEAGASPFDEAARGQFVMVSVSDTGTGMDAQTVSKAIEPFFTTKAVGRGSGLGLSMVYGFVRQSRGHIRIHSAPGEGTSVRLYFPRSPEPGDQQAPPEAEDRIIGGDERILVVEDDALVREHLAAQLGSLGYEVIQAATGPEGLEALQSDGRVRMLLTDVVMPGGLDGRELAEAAAKLRPGVKVLFTSGYAENAIVHDGRLDPGVELLSKPYRRRELAAKVRQILDSGG
jgi:PAS domain S-box-containing protein